MFPQVEIEKTTTDMKIEEIGQYVAALEKQLQNVNKHATLMVKRSRDSGHTLFEFAQSLTWLGQCEGDELGSALTQMGTALDTMSVAATKHSESEMTELEEPLEEYARYTASVKAAVQVRQDKKGAYIAALTDLEVKQAAYNKASSTPGKEKDAAAKQEGVEKAQQAVDKTKSEFDAVSEKLIVEFENFKRQKSSDIRNILLSFVKLQIDFSKKCEQSWAEVVPVLEAMATSSPVMPAQFANYGAGASSNNASNRNDAAPSWVYGSLADQGSEETFVSSNNTHHNSAAVADEEFVGV
jgi:sorting nexin-1/2